MKKQANTFSEIVEKKNDRDLEIQVSILENKIENAEKRIEDVKWFIGGLITLIAVIGVIFGWNFSSERESLRDFEKNIKEDLGKIEVPAELELLNDKSEELNGKTIQVEYESINKDSSFLILPYVIRNKGLGSSGKLFAKVYSNFKLGEFSKSTDEQDFKFETYFDPSNFENQELPGQFSTNQVMFFPTLSKYAIRGRFPIMIKLYYGKGRVAKYNCYINIR